MKNNLISSIAENTAYVIVFGLLILAMFVLARLAEVFISKKTGDEVSRMTTRKMVVIGVFSD